MKLRKQSENRRTIIYLILIIFLLTYTILSTIGKKSSDNIIEVSNTLINDLIIDIVNSSIKNDILKQNNINNLIEFNYNSQKEIESINYNIETAYDILVEVKNNILSTISNSNEYKYYYKYYINNNNIDRRIFMKLEIKQNILMEHLNYVIKGISSKVYEQAIGFLRIVDGTNPLDKTDIHPDNYQDTLNLLKLIDATVDEIGTSSIKEKFTPALFK